MQKSFFVLHSHHPCRNTRLRMGCSDYVYIAEHLKSNKIEFAVSNMAFEHWFIPPKFFGILFILKAPLTSCGGTLKVWVLISIFSKTSTHGMMKNTPGPRVPPVRSNPRRNMTALSYSWRRRTVFREYLECLYLDHLNNKEKGQRHGDQHQKDGEYR